MPDPQDRTSPDVYRLLVQNAVDGFVMHDEQGAILEVNRRTCMNTGWSRTELLQMRIHQLIDVDPEAALQHRRDCGPGTSMVERTLHLRRDRTTFPAEVHVNCELIDGRKVFLAMVRDISERVSADRAIRELNAQLERRIAETTADSRRSTNLLRAVMDAAPDLVFVKDRCGRYLFANEATAILQGLPADEILGRDDTEIFPPDLARTLMETDRNIMDSGIAQELEEYPEVDGERRTYLSNKAPYRDDSGTVIGIIGISRDMTAARRNEAALQRSEARWQFAIDGAGAGIWDWDLERDEVFYSQRWKTILGLADDAVGTSVEEWSGRVHPDDLSWCWDAIEEHLRGGTEDYAFEHRMRAEDGSWRWIDGRGRVIERADDGEPLRVIGTIADITERRTTDEAVRTLNRRLQWRADHDDLTGLLGRSGFIERATRVVAERRADGRQLAVLWVDLDAFKRINDSLGHQVGDAVLRSVASRLLANSGPGDLVARLGGDEFALLRPHAGSRAESDVWAERVRAALARPVIAEGITLTLTCSIGLVESAAVDDDISQLLIDSDLALYQAKRAGRNRIERYTSRLRASLAERADLAGHLRTMIERGEVRVRYQPIIALDTERVIGAEALARMTGPDGRELSPAEFLPHLEALGLLTDLATVVLTRACADFAAEPGLGWVSVNLTSEDLAHPQLPERIAEVLADTGLDPARLVLEINEQVVPEPHILGAAQRLTELGARVALDDFGTGWSSLAQLRDLNLGLVKIDRSVVVAATTGQQPQLAAMLTAALAMAHALGLDVIAEGIENPVESQTVAAAGAGYGQGYLWNPALDLSALRETLRARTADPAHPDTHAPVSSATPADR